MTTERVTVQSHQRPGRRARWAYVIDGGTFPSPYVSAYRYSSAESARRAGEEDARLSALFAEGEGSA